MNVPALSTALLSLSILGSGCQPSSAGAAPGEETKIGEDLPCNVRAVLSRACAGCHGDPPRYGAPIPLVTLADLHAASALDPSQRVYERVAARIHSADRPMPQLPLPQLGAEEMIVLDRWIAAGAPAGSGACRDAGGGVEVALSCAPDMELSPRDPWVMPATLDDAIVCYGVDVDTFPKRQIVGLGAHIDNASIVHHVTLFQADGAVDPAIHPCPQTGEPGWRVISVWTPGVTPTELPEEAGFPLTGQTHFAVQVHYSNLDHRAGQRDSTGYELCTTDKLRPYDADVLVFGPSSFSLPPHSAVDMTCDLRVPEELDQARLISALPHMHPLGKSISTVQIQRRDGAQVDLGTRSPWSFEAQYWSPIDARIKGGDTIRTRCVWDNPGNAAVGFGEGTTDEMCWSFTLYYPKVTASAWRFTTPSERTICHP